MVAEVAPYQGGILVKPLDTAVLAHARAEPISLLLNAGVHLWTPQAIAAHKAAELAKAPPPSPLWAHSAFIAKANERFQIFCVIVMFVAALCLIGSAALSLGLHGLQTPEWAGQTMGISIMALGLSLVSLLLIGQYAHGIRFRGPAQWKTYSDIEYAHQHGGVLPAEAKSLIRIVDDHDPSTPVRVHALIQDERELDPILEIDGHYVLVWDEEGRIVAPPA